MLDKKPIYIGRPLCIKRHENVHGREVLLVYNSLSNELLELNTPASISLLESCDGTNSIEEIIKMLSTKYAISIEKVKEETFSMLSVLEKYKTITYDLKKELQQNREISLNPKPFLDYMQKVGLTHLSVPLHVRFLLTSRCNGRCPYCYLGGGTELPSFFGEELPTHELMKVVDRCEEIGVSAISFMGGEPFLRNDTVDLINYTLQYGISTVTSTNGTIPQKQLEKLSNIASDPLLGMQVSIDGSTKEIHEYHRPGAKYEQVVRCVKALVDYGARINTNTVVTKKNINDAGNIVQFLHDLGVKIVTFSELMPVGLAANLVDEFLPSFWDYYNFQLNVIPKLREDYSDMFIGGKILEPEFWDDSKAQKPQSKCYGKCSAFTEDITIGADGTVIPCAFFALYPEFRAGNVLHEDILQIWNSDKVSTFRRIPIHGKCERCKFSLACYKGCAALKWALHRNIHIPDPKCWYIPGDRKTIYPPKEILETMKPSYQKDLRNKKEIKG